MKNKKRSVKDIINKEGFLIYPIKGTSMLPLLREGIDQVHLVKTDDYKLYDVVLFQSTKTSYILHRIIGVKGDQFAIIGDNSFRVDYKKKDELIAKMQGFYMKDEYIDVTDERYINYMKRHVLSKENEYPILMENPEEYFFNKFKEASYEIYRYGYDTNYQVDASKISSLCFSEKQRFYKFISEKKAGHIFGAIISKNPEIDISEKAKKYFIGEFELSKLRYLRIEEAKETISSLLESCNINHIYLKGSEIRNKYKVQHMRWSNDIDLYVDTADLDRAVELFKNNLKFALFDTSLQHYVFESETYKLHIELHDKINAYFPADLKYFLENPFTKAVQDSKFKTLYHLTNTAYYLHHIAHMISHTANGEFWGNMYIDTYLMNQQPDLDLNVIKEARLDVFNTVMSNICKSIFESGVTLNDNEKEFEKILFKTSDEISSTIHKGNSNNSFTYALKRLFPSFIAMKYMYPVLKKAPFLLPFCYLARFFSLITKGKIKKGARELDGYKKANKKQIEVFNNVGLEEYLRVRTKII